MISMQFLKTCTRLFPMNQSESEQINAAECANEVSSANKRTDKRMAPDSTRRSHEISTRSESSSMFLSESAKKFFLAASLL